MKLRKPTFLVVSFASAAALFAGCAAAPKSGGRVLEPDSYVYMRSGSTWGLSGVLRIVDWGGDDVLMAVTDSAEAERVGRMSRRDYRQLLTDLRGLDALDLAPYPGSGFDMAEYIIDIKFDNRRNRIRVYNPWGPLLVDDPADDVDASPPHANLVRRLQKAAEYPGLRWDLCTYDFDPRIRVLQTRGSPGEVYFTDDNELIYGATDCDESDVEPIHIVWRSADTDRVIARLRFNPYDADGGPWPRPYPMRADNTDPLPADPKRDFAHLATRRTLCDGRFLVCLEGIWTPDIVAFRPDDRERYVTVAKTIAFDPFIPRQIDLAPDATRAAWISKGRLVVCEIDVDCDRLAGLLDAGVGL